MNKSQKIYFSTGDTGNQYLDKYITVKLEQDVETLEFMSLKLGTADAYQNFNSDYGVLVGRILANDGIGVPNAKISIFLPIDDTDAEDSEIYSLYPYKTPRDKNNDGKRYNLLPRVSKINPSTNQLEPKQAFGSLPIKEEMLGNAPLLEIYKKYYKYTALTNKAGDYMIFGVPTGTQTVHLSCDITDIGEYSMNAASMVSNLGYPESQFTDNKTKIKASSDLNDLPNIETQEITVDVRPFWGDTENFEIGITRQDFRIRAILTNTFTIFGTSFTDNADILRGSPGDSAANEREIRDLYVVYPNTWTETTDSEYYAVAIANKRVAKITEKIYYYPASVSDYDIDNKIADPESDMQILDSSEYSIYKRNGDFVFIINCNRDKIVTDEEGNQTPVAYDAPNGIFTTFRGFVTLEYTEDDAPMTSTSYIDNDSKENTKISPLRVKFKFPQHANEYNSFNYSQTSLHNDAWRREHMKFEAQKFYSFSKFHGCVANNEGVDADNFPIYKNFFQTEQYKEIDGNINLNYVSRDNKYNIGPIQTESYSFYDNDKYEMVGNSSVNIDGTITDVFGSNWLNLCVYFPQIGYLVSPTRKMRDVRTSDFLATQWDGKNEDDDDEGNAMEKNAYFIQDNGMPIAAGDNNTKWYGRSDLHWTDIIEVPLGDIQNMKSANKGFTDEEVTLTETSYRNGSNIPQDTEWKGTWSAPAPLRGGKKDGRPVKSDGITINDADPIYYFFKGYDKADCIQYLYDLGIIT